MLKTKDFLFKIKIISYSLVNYFLVLGIGLQTGYVFFMYLKYKFASTQLFLFLRITTLQVFTVLEVCLGKPAIYNLKMLGGGNHKKGGTKFEWGKQKGKNMIFYLNLAGRKTLVETMIDFYISRYHFSQISRTLFRIIRKNIFITNFYFFNPLISGGNKKVTHT